MKLAALYCRVSTADQNARLQLNELRLLAAQRGWKVFREYVDEGVSGAKQSRPQLDALMSDARKGKFSIVAVWRFDRFARSTTHLLAALEEFRSLGVDFLSAHEAIDTGTPLGKMVFVIVAAVAELERSLIQERVRAGVARARSEGKRFGRPRKGFDYRRAQELKAAGRSVRQIAATLGVSRSTAQRFLAG